MYSKTLKEAAVPGVQFSGDEKSGLIWSISLEDAQPYAVVPGKVFYFPISSRVIITGVEPGQFVSEELALNAAQLKNNSGPWPIKLAENETIDGDLFGNAKVVEKGTSIVSGDLAIIEKKIDAIITIITAIAKKVEA